MISNNMLEMEPDGLLAAPPENSSNAQRIFVPRVSLSGVRVLGVVGKPKPRRDRQPVGMGKQIRLFSEIENG
jgi:hypothetical protein